MASAWRVTSDARLPKAKRPDFRPAVSAKHREGVSRILKESAKLLLRGLLPLTLLLHLCHGRDPFDECLSSAGGLLSVADLVLGPAPLTVHDDATAIGNAQLKNGKNTDISIA